MRRSQHHHSRRVNSAGLQGGAGERLREAEWSAIMPVRVSVRRPMDTGRQRSGVAYVQLRCKCRVQRDWGFDRCNRHVSSTDHMIGHSFCIQCRLPSSVITDRAAQEAAVLWSNFRRVTGTRIPQVDQAEDVQRLVGEVRRAAESRCCCDCEGCLGPEDVPVQDIPEGSAGSGDPPDQPTAKRVRLL
jgi:hypothetical protein